MSFCWLGTNSCVWPCVCACVHVCVCVILSAQAPWVRDPLTGANRSKALGEGPEKKRHFQKVMETLRWEGKSLLRVTPICVHCWAAVEGA